MRVQVAIIGGGPAGISAAIWCKRLSLSHLLLEARAELGGQLHSIHNPIIDYPGRITQNGKEFAAVLQEHVESLGCSVELGAMVASLDPESKELIYIKNEKKLTLAAETVVVATGVRPRRLRIPGEQEMMDRGEVYSATRDAERFAGQTVAVIGGGDRAFEGAALLSEHCGRVILIHRSDRFRARKEYVDAVRSRANVPLMTGFAVEEIRGNGRVEAVRVRDLGANRIMELAVSAAFIRVGVEPDLRLLGDRIPIGEEGCVARDPYGQTAIPGIFVIGDVCTPPPVTSISNAMGQGMAAVKYIQNNVLSW